MFKKIVLFFRHLLTTRYLIQINYKSGNRLRLWFYYFKYEKIKGEAVCEYMIQYNKQVLLLNVAEIESIIVLRTRHRIFKECLS